MALTKRNYVDRQTIITAQNLNDIQDNIIQNTEDINQKYEKPADGIPESDLSNDVQMKLNSGGGSDVTTDLILVGSTPAASTHLLVNENSTQIEVAELSDIPTEQTVSGWGFTKNSGTYSKPSTGIPEADLSAEVQSKLNSGGGAEVTEQTVADWGFTKFDGNYNSLSNKPTIPDAVTSATVSGWGFAKSSEIPEPVTDQHIIDVITAAFPNAEGVGF